MTRLWTLAFVVSIGAAHVSSAEPGLPRQLRLEPARATVAQELPPARDAIPAHDTTHTRIRFDRPRPTMRMARLERTLWDYLVTITQRAGDVTSARYVVRLRGSGAAEFESVQGDSVSAPSDDEAWGALLDTAAVRARDASVVGAAVLERTDTMQTDARYRLRMEDRGGRCVTIEQGLRIGEDGRVLSTSRTVSACQPVMMADVIRRMRRVARRPLHAGDLRDDWAVRIVADGHVDIYLDSVVVQMSSLRLRASPTQSAPLGVDSVSVGLALGHGRSWSVARQSAAWRVARTLPPGHEWRRTGVRFMIPIDSTFALRDAWPVLQGHLHADRTPGNPYGLAWVYAHAPEGYFRGVPERLR